SQRVRIWDAETGSEVRNFPAGLGVAFVTKDGQWVVSANLADNSLTVRDATTGEEVRRLAGHTGKLLALAVSSDGRHAISGGADKSARLWRLPEPSATSNKPDHELIQGKWQAVS